MTLSASRHIDELNTYLLSLSTFDTEITGRQDWALLIGDF